VLAVSTPNPGYVLGASASWVRGDLYVIAGLGKGKVSPAPTSSGAPATSDGLDFPADVSVDGAGNVLVADPRNGRQPPGARSAGSSTRVSPTMTGPLKASPYLWGRRCQGDHFWASRPERWTRQTGATVKALFLDRGEDWHTMTNEPVVGCFNS
jgi:hypothetical protein